MNDDYYFLATYFKRKECFFVSEIYDMLIEDDFFFTKARIVAAINSFIKAGYIRPEKIKYRVTSTLAIKKYRWIGK